MSFGLDARTDGGLTRLIQSWVPCPRLCVGMGAINRVRLLLLPEHMVPMPTQSRGHGTRQGNCQPRDASSYFLGAYGSPCPRKAVGMAPHMY
jgi:hypothetical protein